MQKHANTQLTVLKIKIDCELSVSKYPFDRSYYLKRDPYLRCGPVVMLWQRQEQWNTKETKVARLSLRLKRDDNVVRSLWLELLTGDNPLKWPPLLLSLPTPSPPNATPQPPAALSPCSWPAGWTVTMPLNTTASSTTWSPPRTFTDTATRPPFETLPREG